MIMKAKGGCSVPGLGAVGIAVEIAVLAAILSPAWMGISAQSKAFADEVGKAGAGWKLSLSPSGKLQKTLGSPVSLTFEDTHLREVFQYVRSTFDLNLVVDQRAVDLADGRPLLRKKAKKSSDAFSQFNLESLDVPSGEESFGVLPYISLKDRTLKDVIDAIARPFGLTSQVLGNSVWLTRPEQLALEQAAPLPSAQIEEGDLLNRLKILVRLKFEAVHLGEITRYIQDTYDVAIVVDERAVTTEVSSSNGLPHAAPGDVTDGMIEYLELDRVPMDEALYLLTRQLNLTYTVKGDHVYISTLERVGKPENVTDADSVAETQPPSNKADWVVYVEDGFSKPHAVDLLPASTPLENYTANLARISKGFSEARQRDVDCSVPGAYDPENITVTEIGPWHGYTVFDLANIPAKHRSIVLKDQQGNHRILYTQVCWGSATFDDTPHFVTVQNETLLVYRSETGGSMGNFTEYYFEYDPETRQPVSLSLNPIQAKIDEIIPKDTHVYDAGGFDIATLTYTSAVWKKDDVDCSPTGGRVTMKLEIRDKALVVTEAKYDPAPEKKGIR